MAFSTTANSQRPDDTRTVEEILGLWLWGFLWRLHLKESGCVVGEHRHVWLTTCRFGLEGAFFEAMELEIICEEGIFGWERVLQSLFLILSSAPKLWEGLVAVDFWG